MKSYFFQIICFSLILVGCSKKELAQQDDAINLQGKAWFEKNHSILLDENANFYGTPDWENFMQLAGELYFPLSEFSKANKVESPRDFKNRENAVYVKSFLVLIENNDGSYNEYLKVYINEVKENFEYSQRYLEEQFSLRYDAQNKLVEDLSINNTLGDNFSTSFSRPQSSLTSYCENLRGVFHITNWSDGSVSERLLYTYCGDANGSEDTADEGDTGGGGSGNGNGESSEYEIEYPSCESFEYKNNGTTGVQVAAVSGIWDVVTKNDRCPGIGVAASYQTYYFQLPSWNGESLGATKSADALASAFFDLEQWFRMQGCSQISTGVLAGKMDEFIKDEFNRIGGSATRNAPLGWDGPTVPYKENWTGRDFCN